MSVNLTNNKDFIQLDRLNELVYGILNMTEK